MAARADGPRRGGTRRGAGLSGRGSGAGLRADAPAEDAALFASKRRLRLEMGARRRVLPPEERQAAGQAVGRHLLADPRVAGAPRVALYAALPDELPTRPLFEALRGAGCACLLPRIRARDLEFARVEFWGELLPGAHGILAPPPDRAAETLGSEDLAIVPGVAFDLRGGRLGRGGGFYDRAFPDAASGPALIGAAFALQLVDAVPADSRDRRMDAIVTERELRWIARGG